MIIRALKPFSTGTFAMEQYEIREVEDTLGNELISAGVAVEIGGGSGGGVFAVNLSVSNESGSWVATNDKTYAEIDSAYKSGKIVLSTVNVEVYLEGELDRAFSMTGALVVYHDEVENAYVINAQDASAEEEAVYAYTIYIGAEENEVYYSKWNMNV